MLSNIEDKIAACFTTDQVQFTDFLSPEELSDAIDVVKNSGLHFFLFGGYDTAERKMMALSVSESFPDFPVKILRGEWDKFGQIGHRDILGAVLSTGIERKCVGDIFIRDEQRSFYLLSIDRMARYIIDHVSTIGRCSVRWSEVISLDHLPAPKVHEIKISVSSARIDCVIAAVFNLSRQQSQQMVLLKKVFINHTLTHKPTVLLSENDSVVVRGYGKFVVIRFNGTSKKGRQYILIKHYN